MAAVIPFILPAIGTGAALFGAVKQNEAAKDQAAAQEEQAKMVKQRSDREAALSTEDTAALASQQLGSFTGRGIGLSSASPLQVLSETRRVGERTVSDIKTTGASRSDLLNRQARVTRRQGTAALFAGFGQAGLIGLQSGLFSSSKTV